MLVDRADIFLIKLREQGLTQPDGFFLKATLNAGLAVLGLVEDELTVAGGCRCQSPSCDGLGF